MDKLELVNMKPDDLPGLSSASGFVNIPLLPEETASYHKLKDIGNKDPFDKMLIRQAIELGAQFITKDRELSDSGIDGLNVIW